MGPLEVLLGGGQLIECVRILSVEICGGWGPKWLFIFFTIN